MNPDLLALAHELSERGEPFVLATVVWRRAPSSGKEGSTALVDARGRLHGWLGGACAEPTVARQAREVLEEGSPRLLFLGRPDELEERAREGVVVAPIACQSEGAMEVYLEPVLPKPHLVVIGRSPMVDLLASMAGVLGWRAVVVDEGGSAEEHPGVGDVVTTLDLEKAGATDRSYVVVATQGHYDEDAVERALQTGAAYVGLVASGRRAETVLGFLRERGVPEEALARVRSPAGLDLGHVSHEEIAVGILAELVRLRAAGEIARGVEAAPPAEEATDPVCRMTVEVATARHRAEHEGRTWYFCSAGCREAFLADPARYAGSP